MGSWNGEDTRTNRALLVVQSKARQSQELLESKARRNQKLVGVEGLWDSRLTRVDGSDNSKAPRKRSDKLFSFSSPTHVANK